MCDISRLRVKAGATGERGHFEKNRSVEVERYMNSHFST